MAKTKTGRPRKADRLEQYQSPVFKNALARLRANLRTVRMGRGWTQEFTAHRCGMLFQTYQPIEAGKVNVTLTTLARLAAGMEIDLGELLMPPKSGPRDGRSTSAAALAAAAHTPPRNRSRGSRTAGSGSGK